jgi:sugar lactone lactonase YvrE
MVKGAKANSKQLWMQEQGGGEHRLFGAVAAVVECIGFRGIRTGGRQCIEQRQTGNCDLEPRLIIDCKCETGEAPLWHPNQKCLFWLDIPNGRLFGCAPGRNKVQTFELGTPAGGFTLHEDGRLLLFMADGAVKLWNHGRLETVIARIPAEAGNRFNDVIADPQGRIFCGVMSTPQRAGRLYRLDPDLTLHIVLEGTATANGMGFSPDLKQMYFCDSRQCTISRFDYDQKSGGLDNRKIIVDTSGTPEKGRPDGMTVDAEGCIWSARWEGGAVYRLSPEGEELARIDFPVPNVSSVAFGGPDGSTLYVTTAAGSDPDAAKAAAGGLFAVDTGVKGCPEFRSRFNH